MSSFGRRSACALGVLLACAVLDGATLTRQHAEAFERKVQQIGTPKGPGTPIRRIPVSEDELNSWFAFRAQPVLPEGISNPQVTIAGAGRLTGQATIDLDTIGKRRSSGGWLDPWALLGGRLPLTATGTLQTRNGIGRFALESATLAGVPVPKIFLQELLSLYTRSDDRPRGANLDDPFPLPAEIQQVEVGRGQAVVVQ